MSLTSISEDVTALRSLVIEEFNRLNRKIEGINVKVDGLRKQLRDIARGVTGPGEDETVFYPSGTAFLDATTVDSGPVSSDEEEEIQEASSSASSPVKIRVVGGGEATGREAQSGQKEKCSGSVPASGSSSKANRGRRDSFVSTVSCVRDLTGTPMKAAEPSAGSAPITSTKKRRRLEVDTYLIETDLTVKHGGKILCDLKGFSFWPKGLLSSQLRQQLKKVAQIRELLTVADGDLSVQGVSPEGQSVDLDDGVAANAVRGYRRLIVNL
ncbi:hypothetical protein FOZ60_005741 [Perkinsus olseni]|uniref:Uncharacterized protein n=2 Tax=Perkinsus olseni TaxID=32597 RepID=A0A7J6NQC7_PEROL|nr:hypothetical protein FOZ60_005741 [Perkinsus olseni]KAF4734704.1 hypothetical protein FOZ62_032026 [Perkinsus olseni]